MEKPGRNPSPLLSHCPPAGLAATTGTTGPGTTLTRAPQPAPRDAVPSYCTVDVAAGANWALRDSDGPPVRLKSVVVHVPACPRGYHGQHRVKVRIGGSGFPLVIAHGYTSHSRVYLLVLGLLARWFKVIAIDLAGHGGTAALPRRQQRTAAYADLLLCTMDHLGIEKAVMVGHSLGGRVAAEAVSMQPTKAAALLLANPTTGSFWDQRVHRLRRHPGAVFPLIGRLLNDTTHLVMNIDTTDQSATLLRLGREMFLSHVRAPWRLAPAGLAMLTAAPSGPILAKVGQAGVQTVVIWGEADPVVTRADARSTADLTRGELIVVVDSGHSWPLADRRTLPDIVRSELGGHLGQALDDCLGTFGLDAATAGKNAAETVCYRRNSLAVRLTPPFAYWQGHRQSSHPLVLWQRHPH